MWVWSNLRDIYVNYLFFFIKRAWSHVISIPTFCQVSYSPPKSFKTVIKDCIWHRFRKRNAIGFISIGLMNFLFQVAMLTKYLEQRSFCIRCLFSVLILIHTCKRWIRTRGHPLQLCKHLTNVCWSSLLCHSVPKEWIFFRNQVKWFSLEWE